MMYFSGDSSILKMFTCTTNSAFMLIALFNIPELIFYVAIYKHEMR